MIKRRGFVCSLDGTVKWGPCQCMEMTKLLGFYLALELQSPPSQESRGSSSIQSVVQSCTKIMSECRLNECMHVRVRASTEGIGLSFRFFGTANIFAGCTIAPSQNPHTLELRFVEHTAQRYHRQHHPLAFPSTNTAIMPGVSVRDVPADKFIESYAAFLKRQGKLPIPGP